MIAAGEKQLSLQDIFEILYKKQKIEVTAVTLKKATGNFNFLREFAKDKVIYGINTGFGPMAQHRIAYSERLTLQYNLIRSHASGSGKPIDVMYAKAPYTVIQRAVHIHPTVSELIPTMLGELEPLDGGSAGLTR